MIHRTLSDLPLISRGTLSDRRHAVIERPSAGANSEQPNYAATTLWHKCLTRDVNVAFTVDS